MKMENMDLTKIKKVLLVGAGGKTGLWYSRLMLRDGIIVYAYDQNEKIKYADDLLKNQLFIKVNNEEFLSAEILKKVDSVTLSPGVPLKQDIFIKAENSDKYIFSELEYSYGKLKDKKWICVTGTDGKSTTVAMIEHALNTFQKKVLSCGNYGLSFAEIAFDREKYSLVEFLVAELSSYQLELCRNLSADVSLYLNLAPDHLNRYDNIEHYGWVKWHIALAVKEHGFFIVNKNLMPGQTDFWKDVHPAESITNQINIIEIDTMYLYSEKYRLKDSGDNDPFFETIDLADNQKMSQKIVSTDELSVQGNHNFSNFLFCLETLHCLGFTNVVTLSAALKTFKSLPHRFENITSRILEGNTYINDSKATTTQAAMIAIKNVTLPLFLFLGGRSKGEDYGPLAEVITQKGALVFLFGENRKELESELLNHHGKIICVKNTLDEAFGFARDYQKTNQIKNVTYLLSPASTSWDQYSSFEERGTKFREMVLNQVS